MLRVRLRNGKALRAVVHAAPEGQGKQARKPSTSTEDRKVSQRETAVSYMPG